MLWIITGTTPDPDLYDLKAFIGFGRFPPSTGCRVPCKATAWGVPSEGFQEFVAGYASGMPVEFQLLDDDGNLYLTGRAQHLDGDSDECFEPLDFFESKLGVTTMQYREYRPEGKPQEDWKEL
jgi:hypothetical protein